MALFVKQKYSKKADSSLDKQIVLETIIAAD